MFTPLELELLTAAKEIIDIIDESSKDSPNCAKELYYKFKFNICIMRLKDTIERSQKSEKEFEHIHS